MEYNFGIPTLNLVDTLKFDKYNNFKYAIKTEDSERFGNLFNISVTSLSHNPLLVSP